MPSIITQSLFIALCLTSAPVFADTLEVGTVYFDSEETLNQMIKLSEQHDNDAIAKLINQNGHVGNQTAADTNIIVLTTGSTPESPAEFRFVNGTTNYWTLTKYVTNVTRPIPESSPVSTPTLTPEPTPAHIESPTTHRTRLRKSNSPFDDDNGQRIWHQVDGKWKWYPANKHHVTVKKALPPDEKPVVNPDMNTTGR
jgi:hypothetical protein